MSKTVAEMVGEARARVETVSPKDASVERVSAGVVFLDVREPVEWEHHIEGAVQIPRGTLECAADPVSPAQAGVGPGRRVIVYCRTGVRRAGLRDPPDSGLRQRGQPRGRLRRLARGRPARQRAPRWVLTRDSR